MTPWVALVEPSETAAVLEAARGARATGSTVISQARGEGAEQQKTFFGMTLETQRDLVLLLVEEHLARRILETIAEVGHFEERTGFGIAFQVDRQDAVGISHQDRAPERVNIYEIMWKSLITVSPDVDICYCAQLFARFDLSRAPVVAEDEVVGIVSLTDLVIAGMAAQNR